MKKRKFLLLSVLFGSLITSLAGQSLTVTDSVQLYLNRKQPSRAFDLSEKMMRDNATLPQAQFFTEAEKIGDIFLQANEKQYALTVFSVLKELHEKKEKLPETIAYGNSCLKAGQVLYRQGHLDKAIDHVWLALKAYKGAVGKNSKEYQRAARFFGDLYYDKGNYLLAERIYQSDLKITKTVYGKYNTIYAEGLLRLGRIQEIKGDLEAAEGYYAEASEKIRMDGGKLSLAQANTLAHQANLYFQKGSYTASEALYRQAMNTLEQLQATNTLAYAQSLRGMARINMELNNYTDARDNLVVASTIITEFCSEQHPEYAITLIDMSKVFINASRYDVAAELVTRALDVSKTLLSEKHPVYVEALAMQADIERIDGNTAQSEIHFVAALDTLRQYMGEHNAAYGTVEAQLANLYYQQGDYERAVGMHQLALDLRKDIFDELHPQYGQSLNDLAIIFWANQQLSLSEQFFSKSTENYIRQYQRYFTFLSEREKSYFYDRIGRYFEKFNNFAVSRSSEKPGLLADMYNNQLMTKAVLFHSTQQMRNNVLQSKDNTLIEKYIRWLHLKELLSKVYKLPKKDIEEKGIGLDSLENTANLLEKELSLRSELISKKSSEEISAINWKQIQEALAPNEAAIEIVRFQQFAPDSGGHFLDKVYYGALIITRKTKSNPALVLLDNGTELETKYLNYYRNSIKLQTDDVFSYKMFWEPIAKRKELDGIKKIFISPDGVYHQVNLNSLVNAETGKYVLDEVLIHTVTNTRDVLKLKTDGAAAVPANGKSLLVGFPDYYHVFDQDGDGKPDLSHGENLAGRTVLDGMARDFSLMFSNTIQSLPGTKVEIESVAGIFDRYHRPAEILLGTDAFENVFKKKERFFDPPVILHVATHGFFQPDQKSRADKNISEPTPASRSFRDVSFDNNDANPLMRSGILLASAGHAFRNETLLNEVNAILRQRKYEDGVLSAYEAMNLNLSGTELVVLSACETGLGELKSGEGVYGLQRSLQTAGARSVVMSLWKVDDEATGRFMIQFYEYWFQGMEKREAFRKAQLHIREQFPQPYYWGAFVMVGN